MVQMADYVELKTYNFSVSISAIH
ncbi:hypothetical protein CCACVL1_05260 [Corchorus capsularis]|uniref:Uncharacterized protein n=1 Tax=Corchorus capsularis TaxID=210143 RepID=A0A1R3JLR0_COCAP|nr:hypothetical protein CCACVL1_05260 [Corchorus capsularis]